MIIKDYQTWLNAHGQNLVVDGEAGPSTSAATKAVFTNLDPRSVTDDQLHGLADAASVSYEQLVSVATVESAGEGYDVYGKPKMLYERHKFHSCTGGKYSTTSYSNPSAGGYNENSWDKLCAALGKDIECAFKSCSWGKFQIMGFWYPDMKFTCGLELAYSTVISEYRHYRLLIDYIRISSLLEEMRLISTDPDDCRPFAKGYNGSNYEAGGYHEKLAAEMRKLTA